MKISIPDHILTELALKAFASKGGRVGGRSRSAKKLAAVRRNVRKAQAARRKQKLAA